MLPLPVSLICLYAMLTRATFFATPCYMLPLRYGRCRHAAFHAALHDAPPFHADITLITLILPLPASQLRGCHNVEYFAASLLLAAGFRYYFAAFDAITADVAMPLLLSMLFHYCRQLPFRHFFRRLYAIATLLPPPPLPLICCLRRHAATPCRRR